MAFKAYPIFDLRAGKISALDPWLLPKDAFSVLNNAHLRYGVLEKRRGYIPFGQLTHVNPITTFADAGSGKVTVTLANAHGLSNGAIVVITGTTSYNGTFVISEKATTTFKIVATWVANDATGLATNASALTVMGIYNYYKTGSAEKLIAMDTERLNTYNNTTKLLVDATRIMIHFKKTGQTIAPAVDEVCEGNTSKAVGTVENVVIDHGSFAGKDADGWIIFKNTTVSGTFVTGEELHDKAVPTDIYGAADGTQFTNVFTGDDADFFWYQGSAPSWSAKGYFVNNKDQIQRYDATPATSTPFQIDLDVEGGPDNDVDTCLLIFVVKNRLVFLNTVEKGTRYLGRARWSEVNNPEIIKAASYKDSPIDDEIVSADFIGDELYVAFTKNIMRLTYTGDATEPFKWEVIDDTEGSRARMSTTTFSDELITIGATKLIGFDRRSAFDISEKIPNFILEMDQGSIEYCYGLVLEEEMEIYESYTSLDSADALPDKVLALNYDDHAFATYDLPAHVFGYYDTVTDLILDDLADGVSCDDLDFSLDDVSMQAGYPITLMGCRDGWIYRLNYGGTDNGAAIEFEVKGGEWNPYSNEGRQACLGWVDFLVENDGTSFDARFYLNSRSSSYQTKSVSCYDADSTKRLLWKRVFSGAVANFHLLDIYNNAETNRPRIHAIVPYFEPAGDFV